MEAAGHHFTSSHVPERSDIRNITANENLQIIIIQPLFMTLPKPSVFFYVLLTVHLSIILVINQPDAQNLVLQ